MRQSLIWSLAAWMVLIAAFLAARTAHRTAPLAASLAAAPRDPVLARCRSGGEAAARDPDCQAAWRKTRDQFFGRPAT